MLAYIYHMYTDTKMKQVFTYVVPFKIKIIISNLCKIKQLLLKGENINKIIATTVL